MKRYATAIAKKIDIRPHIVVRTVKKTNINHLLSKNRVFNTVVSMMVLR